MDGDNSHVTGEKTLTSTSEIDVKVCNSDDTQLLPNDRHDCDVWAICPLSDGMFLVVDHGNEKLKRLDHGYRLVDSVDVENIRDVCEVRPGLAALAMYSKLCGMIQLISVGMSMTKTSCFSVGDVCRSLTYVDSKLFVCHPSHIATYSLNGDPLQTFKHDRTSQNIFTSLWGIDKNAAQKVVYVCDDENGLVILDLNEVDFRAINNVESSLVLRGLCVTSTGHVVVCDKDSNSVMHLIPHGRKLKTLLKTTTDVKRPRAVCFDSKRKKLLVACTGSAVIKVFDLEKSVLEEMSLVVL